MRRKVKKKVKIDCQFDPPTKDDFPRGNRKKVQQPQREVEGNPYVMGEIERSYR